MFFPVKKIFWGLVAVVILLMAVYTFNTLSINFLPEEFPEAFVEKFHIDREANVPTWFSAAVLFSSGIASFLIYKLEKLLPDTDRFQYSFWLIFMGLFFFLSLDEAAMVHEFTGNLLNVGWVYLYAPAAVLLLAYCLYSLWGRKVVEPVSARWITIGMVLAIFGGLFMEWVWFQFPLPYAWSQVRLVLEEGGEMLGAIFILRGVLTEANHRFQQAINTIKET